MAHAAELFALQRHLFIELFIVAGRRRFGQSEIRGPFAPGDANPIGKALQPAMIPLRPILARIYQRVTAARAQWPAMTALRLIRVLDVLHEYGCGLTVRRRSDRARYSGQ